jgi:hypothetical protein
VQAAFSVVMLGTCGHVVRYFPGFGPAGLGIFTSILTLGTAVLYLVSPRVDHPELHRFALFKSAHCRKIPRIAVFIALCACVRHCFT